MGSCKWSLCNFVEGEYVTYDIARQCIEGVQHPPPCGVVLVDVWCVRHDMRPTAWALAKGNSSLPCGVVLVDVWCDERKGWNQHERAGDQLNDVTQREGDWEEKRLFFSE